ncbi:MAG: pyrroline-5-carboxylate reductase [Proteobacteria bacterium]|nr:pyrroline-5-carboxylate reductase [Pseudomonadota bacterium]
MKKLAIIGLGNMGQAILKGLLASDAFKKDNILCFEKIDNTAKKIKEVFNLTVEKVYKSLSKSDYILIAVKPQQMDELLKEIKGFIKNQTIISIAAGISTTSIKEKIGDKKVVRAMPNTPALIGKGITGVYLDPKIENDEKLFIEKVLSTLGSTIFVDKEEDIDKITALSGSGPAYVYFLMEAFIDAGVYLGLSRETAKKLVISTFCGSSILAESSDKSISELKEMVTSPGGTTIYGLSELESNAVKSAVIKAVNRAYERAKELGSK